MNKSEREGYTDLCCREELFYETLLYDFQNLGLIKLSNPLPLEDLMMLGLKTQEAEWNSQYGKINKKLFIHLSFFFYIHTFFHSFSCNL